MQFTIIAFIVASCDLPHQSRWATVSTAMGTLHIAVHERNDIVSNNVYGWELGLSNTLFAGAKRSDLFVDIGANIGVHSVRAAAIGLSVIAVEPMWHNQKLLAATLCRNPGLNITVLPVAVGAYGDCDLYSGNINIGDCHLVCEGRPPKSSRSEHYIYRGKAMVRPVETIVPATTKILKVDIEGSECNVFKTLKIAPQTVVAEITVQKSKQCVLEFADRFQCVMGAESVAGGDMYMRCKM